MIYYGHTNGAPLTCHMIYGSPVKFLLHPEVRDSKFDEHAQAGVYACYVLIDDIHTPLTTLPADTMLHIDPLTRCHLKHNRRWRAPSVHFDITEVS